MSSDVTVFGISPGYGYGDRHFAFVPVSAVVADRRLKVVVDPRQEFPTEGNVFLAEEYWIPQAGVGAIWRARRGPPATDSPHAEYSVIARGREGPLEIVSIPISSARPNGVREFLRSGVALGYTPASTVLVRLEDGVVVGPIKGEGWSERGVSGFRCNQDAFSEPLDLWSTIDRLEPVRVPDQYALDQRRRTFTSFLDLPPAERWFDGAVFADCVRSVLKHVVGSKEGASLLSRRQMNDLARTLSDETFPERLMARVKRVQRAVQSLALTQEELDALLPVVAESEQIRRELDDLREHVRIKEIARIAEEEKNALTRIAELRQTAATLGQRIQELTERVPQAEQEIEAAARRVVERVRERLSAAIDDPADLLAQVALLRPFVAQVGVPAPFLSNGAPSGGDSHSQPLTATAVSGLGGLAHAEPPPASADELLAQLRDDLRAAGLNGGAAKLLAHDVLAALLAGQLPVFSGSLATLIARACALSCSGAGAHFLSIPVGLLDDGGVRRDLQRIATMAAKSGTIVSLVLDGLDRSAVEVYGGILHMLVTERVLRVGNQWPGLLLFGTLVGGPAALPVTSALTELGPIFETDILTLSSRRVGAASMRTAPLIDRWTSWRDDVRSESRAGNDTDEIGELCSALGGEESLLWRRGVAEAYRALLAIGEGSAQASIDALVGGWILPRARAVGISGALRSAALRRAGIELPNGHTDRSDADPRLGKLLRRYKANGELSDSTATLSNATSRP